jgi:polyprenyl-phospho-N-acetylgalactosaminyl synthase
MEEHPKTKIIFGSRFMTHAQTNLSLSRRILLKLAIVFTFFMSQIKLSDTHNGYRLIRREILNQIHITLDGM